MIGFDVKDSELLEMLERDMHTVPSLAKLTGMSRKTIAYRLERLYRYRLVNKKQNGGKTSAITWSIRSGRKQHKNIVRVYRGIDLPLAYDLLLDTPKNTVLYSIEGADMVRRADMRRSRTKEHASWQRVCRRRNIIRKAIVHAEMLQMLKENPPDDFFEPKKQHHIVDWTLPFKSLIGPGCYIFLPYMLIIANEEKRYAVVVKDVQVTQMLYDVVELLFEQFEYIKCARPLNFQTFIREVARNQKKQ